MKTKASTYVRKLSVGDAFVEDNVVWLVTRNPEVTNGSEVVIWLSEVKPGTRRYSRRFVYDIDARIRLS